jgi:hypothetical protein
MAKRLDAFVVGLVAATAVWSTGCHGAASPPQSGADPDGYGSSVPLTPAIEARMRRWSWRPGCPVELRRLRYLRVPFVDSRGREQLGELVVHESVAEELVVVMAELHAARFPIERMQLIDAYGGSDARSMEDNNTSAWNCREQTSSPGIFSDHSYGTAIDINPKVNPYARPRPVVLVPEPLGGDGRPVLVAPPSGAPFLDRSAEVPGLIRAGDACHHALTSRGWTWGGAWTSLVDYQHFEKATLADEHAPARATGDLVNERPQR